MTPQVIVRFWSKVQKTPSCWLWTGATTGKGGYGQFRVNGKLVLAHRFAYELAYGPLLPGLDVLHSCDNPGCVRHGHLFSGTVSDNMRESVRKKRHAEARKMYCPAGHAYDQSNTYVRANGSRQCRTCNRQRMREEMRKRRAAAKEKRKVALGGKK